jgi:hypothetical protein
VIDSSIGAAGTYRRTGRSRSTLPSSASWSTSVAVKDFVVDPTMNSVSGVTGWPVLLFAIPLANVRMSSPSSKASEAPTTP